MSVMVIPMVSALFARRIQRYADSVVRRQDTALNPQALRAYLRGGVFIAGLALLMMLIVPRESAEFVVSTCSLLIGLALMLGVGLLTWWMRR